LADRGLYLGGGVAAAFSPGAHLGSLGPIRNPLGIEGLTQFYKAVLYTMSPALFIAAAFSLFVRPRRAVGVERQQLKWLAYAAGGLAIVSILVIVTIAIDTPRWYDWSANAIFVAVIPGVPIAIGIAILRYRLYEIDVIINRILVYGSLTAVLVALYFGGVATTQAILQALTGREELPQPAVVASTLVIAALFNPLRQRVQNLVDRSFYRRKYDAAKTLETFSAKLRDETDLDSLNSDLLSVVRDTMQPEHVSLWLRPEVVRRDE
jgi:hypothetical protein